MKTLPKSTLPFLLASILILLISCKKEEIQKERTNQDLWNCHTIANKDEEATKQHLIGTWIWKHKVCPFNPNDVPTSTEHEGLSAEFKSDKTLIIRQDGELVLATNWDIVVSEIYTSSSPALYYKLQTDTIFGEVYGTIILCDNEALFTSSYLDGCDIRFEKKA